MASMQDSLDSSLENPLFPVARALARSKIVRTFVSLLTLAIFAGLAYSHSITAISPPRCR